jgi:hypothetical protein
MQFALGVALGWRKRVFLPADSPSSSRMVDAMNAAGAFADAGAMNANRRSNRSVWPMYKTIFNEYFFIYLLLIK